MKKDWEAAAVVGTATIVLAVACLVALRRLRQVLKAMKTRWLVTIALFGAAAFAVVNVPTTLLNDFFHIILGPFGFIVTGLFHGVFLYMMIVALVMLIPQPGVVALMTMIRMLLGMLAFGQVTPIGILVYGTHAFLLELLLTGSGTYKRIQSGHAVQRSSWQLMLLLAVICGLADSAATYINLQGMAFLYRLYYADWYIALILLLNGFAYTAVGAACGTLLGSRLSKVEVTKRMKPIISLHSVAYTYKHRRHASVSNISLEIFPGEFVLLTGPTGCGKSTLLKMFNGLIPHGSGGIMSGQVRIDGRNTLEYGIAELSQTVGMVFQSPEDQIFSTTVFDETAFILENMGMNPAEITLRVQETLKLVGMFEHRDASIHALSGGQKQRLAVASVLAARPAILALDEPISQLDPQGAAELLTVLQHVNRELGMTIVIVEHRLHEVMPLCRRVMIMDQGMLVWQGTREEAFQCPERFDTYGLRLPQTVDICRHLAVIAPSSRVDHAVTAIQEKYQVPQEIAPDAQPDNARVAEPTPVVTVDQLSFYYDKARPPVLADLHLTIPKGQFVALMGNNGAGKSTLLHLIGGLLQADKGTVQVLGQRVRSVMPSVGMVLQNPDFMLFNNTVAEEISFVLRQKEKQAVWPDECKKLVQQLGLTGREDDFPLALSRGQRLRVAIAAVLAARPAVLLLDEPTTGQDIGHIEDIVMLLKSFTAQGGAVVFCTHDAEVAARFADRIVVLSGGQLMADGPASTVFTEQAVLQTAGLKPPAALLVARELYGGKAVTVKEVVSYVRQKCLGSNAGEHAASSSGCPYKANHSD